MGIRTEYARCTGHLTYTRTPLSCLDQSPGRAWTYPCSADLGTWPLRTCTRYTRGECSLPAPVFFPLEIEACGSRLSIRALHGGYSV